MWEGFPLFPQQASTIAGRVDALYYYLVGVSLFFSTLIFVLIFYFAVKYRRRHEDEIPPALHGNLRLEILWAVIPFVLAMGMFGWGAVLYFDVSRPPADPLEMTVVAKQWMWKIQHPEGQREINELHVPVDRPVRLTMASEDVIHSFFIPAFRVKRDVVPGRFTQLWFQATAVGEYHLFCAEYCGTKHSEMVGRVVVMEPVDYQNWLGGVMPAETPVATGERLFDELGCKSCHRADTGQRGPSLEGLFMQTVPLTNGETVIADQDYLRQSILAPAAKLRVGYGYLMPTFRGQVSEEQLLALIAYIKSLAGPGNRS